MSITSVIFDLFTIAFAARYVIIISIIIIVFFLVLSIVKIPRVKKIKLKSNLEWLTFGVIPIDEGASKSNLIETLY